MRFSDPLVPATFERREKRFTIHARLADGAPVAAHTNNTGRMTGCLARGGRVWLSPARNPARKLRWSLELVEADGVLVGVNTALANVLAAEAITAGLVPGLDPGAVLRREVALPDAPARADLVADGPTGRTWIEVKNVSLVADGHARFPDAPTARGRRHLQVLMDRAAAGDGAVLLLCSQRADATSVGPADDIDRVYGSLLRQAVERGVTVHGLGAAVRREGIAVDRLLPLRL
jgi:sugar fermentation stimulation protein A